MKTPKITKKLRKKYDENKDNFININEFLKKESLGPEADAGEIDYHYQDTENIVEFFLKLMTFEKDIKLVCIPKMYTYDAEEEKFQSTIIIYIKNLVIRFPDRLKYFVEQCTKKGIRFIGITLLVYDSELSVSSHANVVIIDTQKKTVERFEPFGSTTKTKDANNTVNNMFSDLIKYQIGKEYTYLPPNKISSPKGVQRKADAWCGMCVTWALMYLHLRLLNPDTSQKKVVQNMKKGTTDSVRKKIKQYARHIENVLKS